MTDISIVRGDDRDYDINVTSEGDALNITGATIRFAARFAQSDFAFIEKSSTVSGQIDITNAPNGEAILHLDPADTELLIRNRTVDLEYDLELEQSGGTVTTVASGTLTVSGDVAG